MPTWRGDGHLDEAAERAEIRTFLIADVRGYTLFTQERGDEAAAKLAAKFADIAREVVEVRGGTLLELRGDEAMCVFTSPREAIRAAVDLQRRFVEETRAQPELPLTVGVGLDAGEAVRVGEGYRGGALNLAARLCGHARAGEILGSREITHLAGGVQGVRYVDRGAMRFKNLPDPVSVVAIVDETSDTVEELRPFATKPSSPPKRSRALMIGVGAALALALIAVAIPLLSSDGPTAIRLGSNSVARLAARDGGLDHSTPLPGRPGATATGFGSVWITQPDSRAIVRLNAEDGSIVDRIGVGADPGGIAVGDGSVWVTNTADGTVSRIDPETGTVTGEIVAGSNPEGIALGDGALWVADTLGASLLRIDPASGDSRVVKLEGQPGAVAFTGDGVWVSVEPDQLLLIDPRELSVTLRQQVGTRPAAISSAFGSIWVANDLDGTVTRLEASTGDEEARVQVGDGPTSLAAGDGSLWVAVEHDDAVVRIDPDTNGVEGRLPVGAAASSLAVSRDAVWLAVGASARDHRGGTLVVSSGRILDAHAPSLDPAIVYSAEIWQILVATNDGLLAYESVGGPAGVSLVPDLAASLPDVSEDGLTYRFALRAGIRYSNGDIVAPEDFRRGIERAVAMHGVGPFFYGAIDGAADCTPDPPACDLTDGIEVDAHSVTFHLTRPDPELPFKLALPTAFPVPASTPFEDRGLDPLPATGPYMVDRATTDGIRLVRNPEFEEWSGAAQPAGFVDEISWGFEEDVANTYARLNDGEVDVMVSPPRPDDVAALASAHPDQLVRASRPFTFFVAFDVRKPPFDDVRLRQALSYAIDREHIVDLLGGSTLHRLTCQVLPPNFQGYLRYCPYTDEPDAATWSGPDMNRAMELVRASGAARAPVTVAVTEAPGAFPTAGVTDAMSYITDVLNELGLRARLRVFPDADAYFTAINPPIPGQPDSGTVAGTRAHPNVYSTGWVSDYPAAANFMDALFRCGDAGFYNTGGFCDHRIDTKMRRALLLYTTEPGSANRAWAAIDHELTDRAVILPLTNPVATNAVSDRTGNVQVNPQWGLLLSQLWVR